MIVGQKLLYVPSTVNGRQPEPYDVEIITVGRKWITVSNPTASWDLFRVDKETLFRDSGQYVSVGQCWLSKELWLEAKFRNEGWARFRALVNGEVFPPKKLSLHDIENLIAKVTTRGDV